jgi:hypothetical protein
MDQRAEAEAPLVQRQHGTPHHKHVQARIEAVVPDGGTGDAGADLAADTAGALA